MSSKRGQMEQAPTPQNTPASVAGSYLSKNVPTIPSTINEDDDEAAAKQMLLSNPALLSLIEGKLNTLVGEPSSYIDSLPKEVKNRIYGLKTLQTLQFKLEAEFQAELLELEKKFHAKYEPIFEKRKNIVEGKSEPTSDEIAKGKELIEEEEDNDDENKIEEISEEEEEDGEADANKEKVSGIPGFWLTALDNLGPVADLITERDSEVLAHLVNIKMEYLNTPGFKLIFEFEENDSFSNKQLIKTYYYQKELGYSGDFIYDHAEGCDIKWKDNDSNVTIQVEKRKQRNKHTKQVRTIEKLTPIDSFFNFFSPPSPPKDEDDEEEENEEDEQEEEDLEERLQLDYELGELIKDKLINRAVDWFTGEALQYEFGEAGDELDIDDDEDDDEEEEDDDFDDDDGDDDDSAPKKEQPAECKQQ